MPTTENKQRITDKVKWCVQKISDHYGVHMSMPTIRYDLRGRTGGQAWYTQNVVKFNNGLVNDNIERYISNTVPHEVAHLAVELIYPEAHRRGYRQKRQPHGPRWKEIMGVLGASAERCHDMDVSKVARKRTKYTWKCKTHGTTMELGAKRHATQKRYIASGYPTGYSVRGTCGRHCHYEHVSGRKPAPAVRMAAQDTGTTNTSTGSKLDQCRAIMRNNRTSSRAALINMFVNQAGCTTAGAATYYAKIKQEIGA